MSLGLQFPVSSRYCSRSRTHTLLDTQPNLNPNPTIAHLPPFLSSHTRTPLTVYLLPRAPIVVAQHSHLGCFDGDLEQYPVEPPLTLNPFLVWPQTSVLFHLSFLQVARSQLPTPIPDTLNSTSGIASHEAIWYI